MNQLVRHKENLLHEKLVETKLYFSKLFITLLSKCITQNIFKHSSLTWNFTVELILGLDISLKQLGKEEKFHFPKDFIKRTIMGGHDLVKRTRDQDVQNRIIKNCTMLIKNHYNENDFKCEENWELSVEILKYFSSVSPKTVRNSLKYRFDDKGFSISNYKEKMISYLGEIKAEQIFNELETYTRKIVDNNKSKIVFFNATFSGGGVAEMLQTAGPILAQLGIEIEWHIFYPSTPYYFEFTKNVHNTIQGNDFNFSSSDFDLWSKISEDNVNIHQDIFRDPQVALVSWEDPQVVFGPLFAQEITKEKGLKIPTNWRCHIDITGIKKQNPGASEVWKIIESQINKLSKDDSVIFQPFNTPNLENHNCHVFTMEPGIDILKDKNHKISDAEAQEIIININHDCHAKIDYSRPHLLVGARFDYWKNIPATIKAFEKISPDNPDVNLLVFGNYAPDDPEGVEHNHLVQQIIEQSPIKEKIHLITNKNKELVAIYKLGSKHHMPYIACSLREGFNLMTDESSMQGTVPFTSDAGGLKRYSFTEHLSKFHVKLEHLANKIEKASDLYQIKEENHNNFNYKISSDSNAVEIEKALFDKLNDLLKLRREDNETYNKLYMNASNESIHMTLEHSLISMLKNYLAITSLSLDKEFSEEFNKAKPQEIISVNYLSTMFNSFADSEI